MPLQSTENLFAQAEPNIEPPVQEKVTVIEEQVPDLPVEIQDPSTGLAHGPTVEEQNATVE